MSKTVKTSDLPEFDMAQYIKTDADVAEYLRQVLEEGEPGELAAAPGHIAKARGMTEIAKASGIKREALYKALRPNAQLRLETVQRVCKALGVKLTATVVSNTPQPPPNRRGHRGSGVSGVSTINDEQNKVFQALRVKKPVTSQQLTICMVAF